MSEDLDRMFRLIKRRFANEAAVILREVQNESAENLERVRSVFKHFVDLRKEYETMINDAYTKLPDPVPQADEDQLIEYLDTISRMFTNVEAAWERYRRKVETPIPPALLRQSFGQSTFNMEGNSVFNSASKLPKIPLPTFNGDLSTFLDFKAQFESMVDSDPSILPVHKLYYLKASLTGTAADVIRDVQLTDGSYAAAWAAVIKRFENKRAIIRAHFNHLFALKKITTETQIRSLLDRVDSTLRSLKIAGLPTDSWSALISYFVSTKLDDTTRRDWENSITDNSCYPSFTALRIFLESRAFTVDERLLETQNEPKSPTKGDLKGKEKVRRLQSGLLMQPM